MLKVSRARGRLVLAVIACLGVAASGFVTATSASGANAPVAIVIDRIVGQDLDQLGTLPVGAEPRTFVTANEGFGVDVTFIDAAGVAVPFNNDVTLEITGTSNNGAVTLSPSRVTVSKNNATARLATSITTSANQVVLTVTALGKAGRTVAPGVSFIPGPDPANPVKDLRFDVASSSRIVQSVDSVLPQGIGSEDQCANATVAEPVCGIVHLPRGAEANVLLSTGACDTDTSSLYAPCFQGRKGPGGAVVQTLFDEPEIPYTISDPFTLVVKCDKSLCGTGPIRGLTVAYALSGNGALVDALACPAMGTMAEADTPCVDYVQSTRDGSADTHLYLLSDGDLRGGIG